MSESISDTILIARQPIFDLELNIFAYELLFRSSNINESGVDQLNGDLATTKVINNTFIELGIEKVVGNKRAFINLTYAFITGGIPLPFNSDHVVLEVLEDIKVSDEVINGIKTFKQQGFTIALDDFIYSEELQPLIDSAEIIKIDILALTEDELIEHVEILKTQNVKLLAEKVETDEQYELCKQLGFDYFQGYFFCRPILIDGKALPDSKLAVLRVLNSLQNPNVTMDEIESLVQNDVSLTFKLLRLINSAAFGLPKKVDSIKQGLVFLGLNAIKSWATVIAFSSLEPKTNELMACALVRAKMCSELADKFKCNRESAFIVGLFSPLEAILEQPMAEILNSLPLDNEIKDALLLKSNNELGALLKFVINYEQNKIETMPTNLSASEINSAYFSATEMATIAENNL